MRLTSENKVAIDKIKSLYAEISKIKANLINDCKLQVGDTVEVTFEMWDKNFKLDLESLSKASQSKVIMSRKAYVQKVDVDDDGRFNVTFQKIKQNGELSSQIDSFQDVIKVISIKKV